MNILNLCFVVPVAFGIITVIPNIMFSDSGTDEAITTSLICLSGSVLNLLGGAVGLSGIFHNNRGIHNVSSILVGSGMFLQITGPVFAKTWICRKIASLINK